MQKAEEERHAKEEQERARIAEQQRIVGIVSAMDAVIFATDQTLLGTKNLQNALLSDLLSGNHEIPKSYDSFLEAV